MASIDTLVLGTVNASWRTPIDAATLVRALAGSDEASMWTSHVRTCLEEVPHEALLRFFATHDIDPIRVLTTYRHLVPAQEGRDGGLERWLGELADAPRPRV